MSRKVTIAQLEADIRWQADQERATARHTSADLRRAMDLSMQRYREKVSANGHIYYLRSFSGTLETGKMTDPDNESVIFPWGKLSLLSLSPGVVRIFGIDIVSSDGSYALHEVSFMERNEYQCSGRFGGGPEAFFGINEGTLGILPAPTHPCKFTLWYLPEQLPQVNDDDEFNPCVPGGEKWVIWDVLEQVFFRDHYDDKIMLAQMKKDAVWQDILSRISSRSRAGTNRRINTRRINARGRRAW